jgi:putative nucleotidyltransferase with HDIG domain
MNAERENFKVLVVDGDSYDRSIITAALKSQRIYEIRESQNGVEALRILRDYKPDVVILDIDHPGWSGKKLLGLLRMNRTFDDTVFLLISDVHDKSSLHKYITSGVHDFIIKPFRKEQIISKVRKALTQRTESLNSSAPIQGIHRTIEGIIELPVISPIIGHIEQTLSEPDVSVRDVSAVITGDPSITTTILKLANSAYFGVAQEVKTIEHAIILLGFKTVKKVVLTAAVSSVFTDRSIRNGIDRMALWEHSIGCASTAEFLSPYFHVDRDVAFIGGLIHDIGKIALDACFPDYYRRVIEKVHCDNSAIADAETDILGISHSDAGRILLMKWQFPGEYRDAVSCHHEESLLGKNTVATLIHLSDTMARHMRFGSGGDGIIPDIAAVFTRCGLPVRMIDSTRSVLQKKKKELEYLCSIVQ